MIVNVVVVVVVVVGIVVVDDHSWKASRGSYFAHLSSWLSLSLWLTAFRVWS